MEIKYPEIIVILQHNSLLPDSNSGGFHKIKNVWFL